MEPGCKADMVPILVGEQGAGKSTGVAAIAPAPENFVEVRLDHDDEEIARRIRGRLVGEIGELRGLQSRDADSIKQFVAITHDTWTPKYVERSHTVPRRLVFIGTTNSDEFLADETGNRRWLPVRVGKVRVSAISEDRMQLWAEARDLWSLVGIAFSAAETLAREVHGAHMVSDVWESNMGVWIEDTTPEDLIMDVQIAPKDRPFSMAECLQGALGIEPKNMTKAHEMRAGRILRRLGFRPRQMKVDGKHGKFWVKVTTS
jgi:predicted P-loop ATPase